MFAHTFAMYTGTTPPLMVCTLLHHHQVYWDYTSPETLVLEYLPGTKINDGPSLDRQVGESYWGAR